LYIHLCAKIIYFIVEYAVVIETSGEALPIGLFGFFDEFELFSVVRDNSSKRITNCNSQLLQNEFFQLLIDIKKQKSRYNKLVDMKECSVCGFTPEGKEVSLETHHIVPQKDCKNKKKTYKNNEEWASLYKR